MYSKEQFIELANYYGENQTPFFFLINFDMTELVLLPLDGLDDIFLKIGNITVEPNIVCGDDKYFRSNPIEFDIYKRSFDMVMQELNYGNTYLINLTFPTQVETNYTLKEVFHKAKAKYKLLYKNKFVLFSPETFIKINETKIYTYPMKGTIDAALINAQELLLNNDKERFEHNTIVDLLRNDLSMVASNIKVLKYRYLDRVTTSRGDVFQTSSEICGELNEDWRNRIGSIITDLLPAGSVTGAPKMMTCRIIHDSEIDDRNFYAGVFGVFDGVSLDSAVNIRFIEHDGEGGYIYRSGGGITSKSEAIDEYNELIEKVYLPF